MHTRILMGMALSDFPLFVGFELPLFLLLFLLLSRHETSFILVLVSVPTITVHSFSPNTLTYTQVCSSPFPCAYILLFGLNRRNFTVLPVNVPCRSLLCLRRSSFSGLFVNHCER
ncbi:hypothetical protein BC827DRAFT_443526 [Russula dissimulans]|jgi:hypothetical protein|nr:hypothetical protein BC827DRAFT_443526 [Russula dissimulans]